MRLIDADETRKTVKENLDDLDVGSILAIIDNAPTVELDEVTELGSEIVNIIKDIMPQLLEIAKNNSRPQGVWLPLKSLMEDGYHSRISFRCDQCRYVEGYRAKYCAGCGARMRGG